MKIKGIKSLRMKLTMYALLSMVATICIVFVLYYVVLQFSTDAMIHEMSGNSLNQVLNAGQGSFFGPLSPAYACILIVCAVIVFSALFLIISYDTILYIKEIIIGIERMKNGDMDFEIRVDGEDELAVIANSINEMRMQIAIENETKRIAEKTKDELITNVAHDLRTPLTSIIGYLDLVRREDVLTPEQKKKYIGIVYDKAKSLETLIRDLFDYTRYDKDKFKIHRAVFDLNQFMSQVVDEFYPSFAEKELECAKYFERKELPVFCDGELLARAVGNLISNAIKYGADGKRVEIYTKKQGRKAVISVVNYGRAIPKEELDKIFDKFYRVENSRSLQTGGTGLGLAIAKNIVELHEGRIYAASGNEGTEFTIELPLWKEGERGNV